MFDPGDVVVVDFPGVTGVKRRPAVVLSSLIYRANRPDVIVGLLTGQIASAGGPTDWPLQDWQFSGLRRPTAFRSFLYTTPRSEVIAHISRLSQTDWEAVRACLKNTLGPL